ncbi:MAG: hypothetical protein DRP06_00280 [Candidatus Aenigmatarchaeota archaeon]|nr:MAG: hypothetical protein DRP06_00280 [Candidatus Aenigmarchaeota archaeon]
MKGDIYIDFAIATSLFVFAFASVFYYFDSEISYKTQNELLQVSELKTEYLFNSMQREEVLKKIIVVSGNSTNEFVNLSDYDIDLILDEDNEVVCFDSDLEGFIANVSNSKFYLYSTQARINKETCEITAFNDFLSEDISTPIYEEFFVELPDTAGGDFCNMKTILVLSGDGFEEVIIKICV